ncbi:MULTISPECIES: serine hydrolase domain-containing protein [unclassified Xanthomonas]|uniref:serine hydrolase domain-containing protein n=1 Tax=unclassified Xanthomonas TaxID=2643310 RepID=UPI002A81013C|nr:MULTISPECIES: serine hydrolase domain-containing protein [unclassified Xanthomonas]MDY4296952.1 serine hydrolase domain-containing protein [Xanthomonas sp. LF02-5]MDY4358289.1 serine hydrolase domain-containing protein [Xanthomonas sp. LF04-12]
MEITRLLLALLAILLSYSAAADDGIASRLELQLQKNRERYGIAGQALLIEHNGRILYRGADGQADITSHRTVTSSDVFPAYSLSKLLVSTLIMQLVEKGQVDLDAPASRYLTTLPPRWRDITVSQFLDHASGIPEYFTTEQGQVVTPLGGFPPNVDALFASLADVPLQFPAGTRTLYTQTNYVVLAALLSAHYHMPYARIAEQRIFCKLGMRHSTLGEPVSGERHVVTSYIGRDGVLQPMQDIPWPEYAYGHAALYLTIDDLHRFLRAITTGKLVSKRTLQRAWQPIRQADGAFGWFAGGWEIGDTDGYQIVGHDGGARDRVRILFRGVPWNDTWIVIYLTNGSVRNVWSRVLVDSAMAAAAPERFPTSALSESLINQATSASPPAADAWAAELRARRTLSDDTLQDVVRRTAESAFENLGVDTAIRIFALNAALFPEAAATWSDLASAHASRGDKAAATMFFAKAHQIERRHLQSVGTDSHNATRP